MGIKNLLKKFYPIPTRSFYAETARLRAEISALRNQLCAVEKSAMEAVWANVFHDTVCQSDWLTDKAFWPGRAALGYQAMYAAYRILNEIKPRHILELGLGQSTKLISQYVRHASDATHFVVENNQEWIDFFKNVYTPPRTTEIVRLDWKIVPYKDGEVRIFDGFKERFGGEKFDFILVDAPLGADMKQYSRIDVLELLPECLEKDFVILIDDTDRSGEQNTVAEIRRVLCENGVAHREGSYNGLKNSTVICSENLGFLTTM